MSKTMPKEQVAAASDAWESLLRAHAVLNRRFGRDSVWEKASMREYDIMYTLAKAGCALSQSELLSSVSLSQPAVSRMLARMETKGLVARKPSRHDARSSDIELTDTGWQLQREMGREHGKQVAEALTKRLTQEEIAKLNRLCDKLSGGRDSDE